MYEIRFKINPLWKDYDSLARRIAMIVDGSEIVFTKESDYKWSIGRNNDWWMDRDLKTKDIVLAYRYGSGRKKEMEMLRGVIIWFLGIELFNKDENKKELEPLKEIVSKVDPLCKSCGGSGGTPSNPCSSCNGKGKVRPKPF